VPPELLAGSGSAKTRQLGPPGRGRGTPVYPEGVPPYVQYSINGAYGTIGYMMKPPYTTITSYDLNKAAIKWQVGFGDHPQLAAEGITGTGITQMRNSVVITASGLLFGIGGDGNVRAYDAETGNVLWVGKLGGGMGVRGSPTMYELDGRAYLLVPVGPPPVAGGRGAAATAAATAAGVAAADGTSPTGYVTFALPKK
jgi:quinoprotein glucose dehydrogenase